MSARDIVKSIIEPKDVSIALSLADRLFSVEYGTDDLPPLTELFNNMSSCSESQKSELLSLANKHEEFLNQFDSKYSKTKIGCQDSQKIYDEVTRTHKQFQEEYETCLSHVILQVQQNEKARGELKKLESTDDAIIATYSDYLNDALMKFVTNDFRIFNEALSEAVAAILDCNLVYHKPILEAVIHPIQVLVDSNCSQIESEMMERPSDHTIPANAGKWLSNLLSVTKLIHGLDISKHGVNKNVEKWVANSYSVLLRTIKPIYRVIASLHTSSDVMDRPIASLNQQSKAILVAIHKMSQSWKSCGLPDCYILPSILKLYVELSSAILASIHCSLSVKDTDIVTIRAMIHLIVQSRDQMIPVRTLSDIDSIVLNASQGLISLEDIKGDWNRSDILIQKFKSMSSALSLTSTNLMTEYRRGNIKTAESQLDTSDLQFIIRVLIRDSRMQRAFIDEVIADAEADGLEMQDSY